MFNFVHFAIGEKRNITKESITLTFRQRNIGVLYAHCVGEF